MPPIKTTDQALAYKKELEALAPQVTFYMTLYLSPELTVEEIRKASKAGVAGKMTLALREVYEYGLLRSCV